MLKKITSNSAILIFIVFVLVHLALFNINFAEWGDSYRILRASEFIRGGSYPDDEKRQPAFSLLLALRPSGVDQIFWGRLEMFLFSVLLFWYFYKLLKLYPLSERARDLALWLMVFNPVLLYWSIRIMADVPFTLLVVITFYYYKKWQDSLTWTKLLLLGGLIGVAVLTRFEGYILGFSLGLGLLLGEGKNVSLKIKRALVLVTGFIILTLPWFLFRNPIRSMYFEEPARRVYDLKMVIIYLVSSMYLFGFTSACFFFYKYKAKLAVLIKENVAMTIFVVLELLLALLWPAAIPRLFTPMILFLTIPLSMFLDEHFKSRQGSANHDIYFLAGLLLTFVIAQYFLKLQFLVLIKSLLLLVVFIQILNILAIKQRNYTFFQATLVISAMVWSLSTIWLHKDIFKAVVEANKYALKELSGTVVYNDVSSVSDWYLNQSGQNGNIRGIYLNMDNREGRSLKNLQEKQADYVMITNEHNTSMEFSADEVGYLEQIKEFRYTIRGKQFFTKIMEFSKK